MVNIDDKVDWRVGYATISILRNQILDYIRENVVDSKYLGKPEVLIQYSALQNYLKKAGGK
jgi:hypothetical protein